MEFHEFLICLVLTVAIELALWRFALRRKDYYADICLMNCATNPLANVLLTQLTWFPLRLPWPAATAAVEALVVLSEWFMLKQLDVKRPLLASLLLNAGSFIIGMGILKLVLKT